MKLTNFNCAQSPAPKKVTASWLSVIAAAMVLLSVAACNSNTTGGASGSDGAADYATRSKASFSIRQQIFCLNLLSGMNSLYPFHGYRRVLDSTISGVNTLLASSQITPMIGHWKCVWGPAVYCNHKVVLVDSGTNYTTANTMYVAQNVDSPSLYVIAIAGTNGSSLYDWIKEDFFVDTAVFPLSGAIYPWDSLLIGKHMGPNAAFNITLQATQPCIMYGVYLGIDKLLAMKDTTQAGAPSLLQFLDRIAKSDTTKALHIWTTGHSLGGTLSPVMALYLNDTKGKRWGRTSRPVDLNCLPTAGFTPGNNLFSAYYDSSLGNSTYRVFNTMDIAHYCFNNIAMLKIPAIYSGFNLDSMNGLSFPGNDTVYNGYTVNYLLGKIRFLGDTYIYTQIFPDKSDSFASAYYGVANMGPGAKDPDNFLQQVITQHTSPYAVYFGVDTFLQVVSNIMHFQPCYFTNGYIPAPITVNTATASPAKK